jgi:hypothetical protein
VREHGESTAREHMRVNGKRAQQESNTREQESTAREHSKRAQQESTAREHSKGVIAQESTQ